jgi:hypothetical protein
MRIFSIVLLVFAILPALAQQPGANLVPAGQLSIPAELSKTVRADKAHPGDPVEFRTVEPVLVGKGIVMPTNTLLVGRILHASPKKEGKNSWLALVVERAEWKQHSLPLHAFVAAQITISRPNNQRLLDPVSAGNTVSTSPRTSRQSARVTAGDDPSLSNAIRAPQEATESSAGVTPPRYPMLENVGILRDKDGTTYLLSSKGSVKLPAGVLLMLRNEPAENTDAAGVKSATSVPGAERQP